MARPKGSKNLKTLQWETFGQALIDDGLPRLRRILKDADDEAFVKTYLSLLEFFKPKLKRIEEVREPEPPQIRVVWDDIEPPKRAS